MEKTPLSTDEKVLFLQESLNLANKALKSQRDTIGQLKLENEHLGELRNIAYDYGVRVETDAVTGIISNHYLEKSGDSE